MELALVQVLVPWTSRFGKDSGNHKTSNHRNFVMEVRHEIINVRSTGSIVAWRQCLASRMRNKYTNRQHNNSGAQAKLANMVWQEKAETHVKDHGFRVVLFCKGGGVAAISFAGRVRSSFL